MESIKCGCAGTYLRDTTNVLVTVLFREAEILVQAETDVVAVKTVGSDAQVQQMLLESGSDSRLARCRQTSEPEGQATLLAKLIALLARKRWVPGNVAAAKVLEWDLFLAAQRMEG